MRSTQPVSHFGPDLPLPDHLRALAHAGIDAAKSAGASYADIRVASKRDLTISQGGLPKPYGDIATNLGYGIRVQVDGAWAFAYGSQLTNDDVVRSARSAVHTARGIAKIETARRVMLPAPVVTGEWRTPIEIDPFSISPSEYSRVLGAFVEMCDRMLVGYLWCSTTWTDETRVFASTTGSLITQRFARALPSIVPFVPHGVRLRASIPVEGLRPQSAGFECIVGAVVQDRVKQSVDDAIRLSKLPVAVAEVGRFPIVFNGAATSGLLSGTLVPALNLSRALGDDAADAGTSFLIPDESLGQVVVSPKITVGSDRNVPEYSAARWDDEGTVAEPHVVIQDGRVVDYFSTRVTKSSVAELYSKRGIPLTNHGTGISAMASSPPTGSAAHVTMRANPRGPDLDELLKQLPDGLVALGAPEYRPVYADSSLGSAAFNPPVLCEVKKGQLTRRFRDGLLQFNTRKLWTDVQTVGGASSAGHFTPYAIGAPSGVMGDPLVSVSAPAMLVAHVDVTGIPRLV